MFGFLWWGFGCGINDQAKDSVESTPDGTEDSGEVGPGTGLNEATLTIKALYPGGGQMNGVPVRLAIDGVPLVWGVTGQPMRVGSGNFVATIGPLISYSTSHEYFPDETDGYTSDGLPLVILDDRRYVSHPFAVTVDEPEDSAEVLMVAMLGEGYHFCKRTVRDYDPDTWDGRGDDYSRNDEVDLQWIDLLDGREIVPLDPLTFVDALGPDDKLVIDGDGVSLALETTDDRELQPFWPEGWREGTGLNDFAFSVFDYDLGDGDGQDVTDIRCQYDEWPFPDEEEAG